MRECVTCHNIVLMPLAPPSENSPPSAIDMLPEELFHSVAEYLGSNLRLTGREIPEPHHVHATKDIRSLSLVSHRLRRICLPFLLSCVHVERIDGIERLEKQCLASARFAASIRCVEFSVTSHRADVRTQSAKNQRAR